RCPAARASGDPRRPVSRGRLARARAAGSPSSGSRRGARSAPAGSRFSGEGVAGRGGRRRHRPRPLRRQGAGGPEGEVSVDIVVKGRNLEVTDHLRRQVEEKLAKADRYDQKIIRIEVELRHERNSRQSDHCQRVEITCCSRGPVVRAEAGASEIATALDEAVTKLYRRLRRAAERRRRLQRRVRPTVPAAGVPPAELGTPEAGELAEAGEMVGAEEPEEEYRPWRIVREKQHPGEPMTVEDALFQMELLGHDFYLFLDKETGRPSVVYRRRAYD